MTHSIKSRGFVFASALFALASLGHTRTAYASSNFPVALQAALQQELGKSFCVPLCNACHLTTAGGPGNYNPFGLNLLGNGLFNPQDTAQVQPALHALLAKNLDSDGDGKSDKDELTAGEMPGIVGDTQICPSDAVQYGCGARIAPAPPPVDRLGLFSAGLVVIGLTLLRRRRPQRRPR